MIRLAVSGAMGKMGSRIIALAGQTKDLTTSVALEMKGHPQIGSQVGKTKLTDDVTALAGSDVLIEFTSAQATMEHLDAALRFKKPMVIGTTGLSDSDKHKIKEYSKLIPIVYSPNMSIGVNLLFGLTFCAASKLQDSSIKIVEAHHVHKKDAPSGTAKKLAEVVKEASGKEVLDIKSIREGEIVGDHDVIFESDVETITLSHHAKTRDIFVLGALEAARWVVGKKAGLYDMQDVLK